MTQKQLYLNVFQYFSQKLPDPETELEYTNPFDLLVAVILSAQCTDKRVNMITPSLLAKFPSAYAMAESTQEEIFSFIKSCSYPNNKAKHLLGMAQVLVKDFKGQVPSDLEDLQKLPGVGRKTANVIAAVVFNKPTMAVDTHVFRVANRIGLTRNAKTPLEVEKQLVDNIPPDEIPKAHHWLILHGRYICQARKPKCSECGLTPWCKFHEQQKSKKNKG